MTKDGRVHLVCGCAQHNAGSDVDSEDSQREEDYPEDEDDASDSDEDGGFRFAGHSRRMCALAPFVRMPSRCVAGGDILARNL